jgi:ParB/RepB/Spo0J family partition protein
MTKGEFELIPIEKCVVDEEFNTRGKGIGDISELTESIRLIGVLEPLRGKAKENKDEEIEIYVGARRLAAAKAAGLTEVPVVVQKRRGITRKEMLIGNITENLVRKNLNPVDEARAFHRMQTEHSMSIDEVTASLGLKKEFVVNRMALLKLAKVIQEALLDERISVTSAFEIDRLPEKKQEKYIGIAEQFKGQKLREMVDKELERLQKKIEGTDKVKDTKEKNADVTEHLRAIRQSVSVLVESLRYDQDMVDALKEVNYRPLDPDHLRTVAELLDDCADAVAEHAVVTDTALNELVQTVNSDRAIKDGSELRQLLIEVVKKASIARAVERCDEGKKPKVTVAIMKEVLSELFE